jgi:hypothetical protein
MTNKTLITTTTKNGRSQLHVEICQTRALKRTKYPWTVKTLEIFLLFITNLLKHYEISSVWLLFTSLIWFSLAMFIIMRDPNLLSLPKLGAEPHYGLGGLGPPQAQGLPPKKKKKLKKKKKKYNFYPFSLKNL